MRIYGSLLIVYRSRSKSVRDFRYICGLRIRCIKRKDGVFTLLSVSYLKIFLLCVWNLYGGMDTTVEVRYGPKKHICTTSSILFYTLATPVLENVRKK